MRTAAWSLSPLRLDWVKPFWSLTRQRKKSSNAGLPTWGPWKVVRRTLDLYSCGRRLTSGKSISRPLPNGESTYTAKGSIRDGPKINVFDNPKSFHEKAGQCQVGFSFSYQGV